ncbi:uncharacterized protein N7484_002302 [Penicillium longicatenatum]|uniref:uncharacterized protein n=1 Tax=Penicillium longicatenatum TaxID=1561947 RepID=UPI0025474414|nr:uncharacterized protein N7484_002302 [Penicillium longicatenatum]KAJ5658653.1 hypothetical protein N7484_002302 [Penicillium longicatenatum]
MTLRSRQVQRPHHPIGLRSEHVAEFERLLWVEPKYDPTSSDEYKIKYDSDDSTLITVTGTKYSDRRVREFRDASGLPMFEAQRSRTLWKNKPWRIRLPGNVKEDLADVKPSGWLQNFNLTFRNALAQDAKNNDDKMVTLEVRRSSALCEFGVWTSGHRKVADIRESMERNRISSSLSMMASGKGGYFSPPRAIMEVLVADGFDFSIASLCAIIICDAYFRPTPPTQIEIRELEKRLNPKMVS